jgi:(S)-ureidoglycine aminohydrolase
MRVANKKYYFPTGGLPKQSQLLTGRSIYNDSYAVIPKGVLTDIVASKFPFWTNARAWILAKPIAGFCETFSQSLVELMPGGGSDNPETNPRVECVLFVVDGNLELKLGNDMQELTPGSYAYIPSGFRWSIKNKSKYSSCFHWIRKEYEWVDGIKKPKPFVTQEYNETPVSMPETNGAWSTTRFVDPEDMGHDMHVNIVNLLPGAVIPFMETHVMEHGIYILQGKGVYRLNTDWVEVEAGDFLWLKAFCPQACYAGGPDSFRYLLYKNVNRQVSLKKDKMEVNKDF